MSREGSTMNQFHSEEALNTHTYNVENFYWTYFVHNKNACKFGHNLTNIKKMKRTRSFGEHLRHLREESGFTLKMVSEQIHIDISLLAKIERNERQPTKVIIREIANFFQVDLQELQNDILSDIIAYKILEEEADISILKVAEDKVKYLKTVHNGK